MNYILIEPFIYKNSKSRIYLKCNNINCNHEWNVSYSNFINQKRNCPECAKKYNIEEKRLGVFLKQNIVLFVSHVLFISFLIFFIYFFNLMRVCVCVCVCRRRGEEWVE